MQHLLGSETSLVYFQELHVMSCHAITCLVLFQELHVMSCHVLFSFRNYMSCHVVSCHVLFSFRNYMHVMSCFLSGITCHVMPLNVIKCLVFFKELHACHVMSSHVMSRVVFFQELHVLFSFRNYMQPCEEQVKIPQNLKFRWEGSQLYDKLMWIT